MYSDVNFVENVINLYTCMCVRFIAIWHKREQYHYQHINHSAKCIDKTYNQDPYKFLIWTFITRPVHSRKLTLHKTNINFRMDRIYWTYNQSLHLVSNHLIQRGFFLCFTAIFSKDLSIIYIQKNKLSIQNQYLEMDSWKFKDFIDTCIKSKIWIVIK